VLQIKRFRLPFPLGLGYVNCYLVESEGCFFLIDTGTSKSRGLLVRELEASGCLPGNLKLILITHGDFDHLGNAAYLCQKYGAKTAMHLEDAGMAEHGDMFWNRANRKPFVNPIASALMGFKKVDRFQPDFLLMDGQNLFEHGLDATILSIPGHSKGSIAVLAAGDPSVASGQALFCGDLLENTAHPAPGSIVDDSTAARASLEKIRFYSGCMVYPGHGDPFPMEQLQL